MQFLKRLFQPRRYSFKRIPPNRDEVIAGFPFELSEVPGQRAVQVFHELRQQGQAEGFSPIIISDLECLEAYSQDQPSEHSPETTIQAAEQFDLMQWLADRFQEDQEIIAGETGVWPDEARPDNEIEVVYQLGRRPRTYKPQVYLAKIPTRQSWEIPAYLPFGGWNECPSPVHQVAIAKHWHTEYGADIAATACDTLEFVVERPPTDRAGAERLALEQYLYCYDIVAQGAMTIRNLAAGLLNGKAWFFWWD